MSDAQSLLNSLNTLVCKANNEGYFTYLNDYWAVNLGWDLSELRGKPFIFYVHPGDVEATQAVLLELVNNKTNVEGFRNRYKKRNGEYVWLEWFARANSDTEIVASAVIITEKVALEEAAKKQKALLQQAETLASLGHWSIDVVKQDVFWSDEIYRIHGVNKSEYTPTLESAIDFYHPDDIEKVQQCVDDAMLNGTGWELIQRIVRPSGEVRDVQSKAMIQRNELGTVTSIFGTFQDITERKNAELEKETLISELAKSNEMANAILSASRHLLITTDTVGIVTQFNAASESVLGYTADEVVGKQTPALWHDEAEIKKRAQALFEEFGERLSNGFDVFTKKARTYGTDTDEWTFIRKDGSRFPVSLTVTCIKDAKGEVTGYLGVIEDITERQEKSRELEAAKQKAEVANIAKSRFLASMSHEIRTPMNGILGTLQLLDDEITAPSEKRLLNNALTSSYYLLTIVNDILDFSKIEAEMLSLETIAFSVRQLLNEVASNFVPKAKTKGVIFKNALEKGLHDVWLGDPVRIKQIMTNLISNAVKFTEKGSVTVALSTKREDIGSSLILKVIDTGIGMDTEVIEGLFERFTQADSSTTRKYGGTGLGMTITKSLVELMNGTLSVDSELGKGTTFTVALPLEKGERAVQMQEQTAPAPDLTGKKILVAEDNNINQVIVQAMLEKTNAEVCLAENGLIAIDKYGTFKPDVILMDIQMPELDGLEACKIIRKSDKKIPIIALTANVMLEDIKTYLDNGFDEHLAKPIEVAKLYHRLQHYLMEAPSVSVSK